MLFLPPQVPETLFFFVVVFSLFSSSLLCRLGDFYWSICKFTNSIFCHFHCIISSSSKFPPPEGERAVSGPRDQRATDLDTFCGMVPLAGAIHLLRCLWAKKRKSLVCKDKKASQPRPLLVVGSLLQVLAPPVFLSGRVKSQAQSQEGEYFTWLPIVSRTVNQLILIALASGLAWSCWWDF